MSPGAANRFPAVGSADDLDQTAPPVDEIVPAGYERRLIRGGEAGKYLNHVHEPMRSFTVFAFGAILEIAGWSVATVSLAVALAAPKIASSHSVPAFDS